MWSAKVYLFAFNSSPNGESVDQLLEDGSEWSDSDTTAHQHSNFVAEPVLVALSKRTVDEDLGEWFSLENSRAVVLTEVVGPGSDSTNVEAEEFLVRSRGDGEGVELSRVLGCTGNLHPLPCLVVKGDWPLEVDSDHLGWKDVGTNHSQL